jgi:hypothetical protein
MKNKTQPQLNRDLTATQPLGGSISAVSWQHLSRKLAASQPWHLTAVQPWLTVELRLQYVFHYVLDLSARPVQIVFAVRISPRPAPSGGVPPRLERGLPHVALKQIKTSLEPLEQDHES